MRTILVTGGAGYIGSIAVEELIKAGYAVVVLDNLSEGHRQAIPKDLPFYKGNVGNKELLTKIFSEHKIDIVMHFAALALVGESVKDPNKYHENNVSQTLVLLDTMLANKINNFIFSSTCAIFGEPKELPITEDQPKTPINPYGQNKLDVENKLKEYGSRHDLRSCSLRYFNAAGASKQNGEFRKKETHLVPLALNTALGEQSSLDIYGTDYGTKDGTCVRDYIHVLDIAKAHILAIAYLEKEKLSYYNLGNGQGFSVKEVVETARQVTQKDIPANDRPRRPGDPAILIGSSEKARKELGWEPKHSSLENIIQSAWAWKKAHPKGYKK